jgi:hypothetical protein
MIADRKPRPRMKDSGGPWLGEVPAHWEVEGVWRGILPAQLPPAPRTGGDTRGWPEP